MVLEKWYWTKWYGQNPPSITTTPPRGLGGVVVIDAAIGAHGRGSRLAHYFTVAATLDKSLTSHCL